MGTAEEEAREAMVQSILNGKQEDKERFIITTLIDIKQNGCAKACTSGVGDIAKSGGVASAIIAIVEGVKWVWMNK
jgi:hypothetical protein